MKILVTADFTEEGLALLRAHGEVVYEPWSETGALLMAEELAEKVSALAVDVLIVEVDLVHEEVFDARDLLAVGCCRGDPLNVDAETATERGIPVVFAPGRNAESVADLALAFMLALARGIVPMHRRLTSGSFDPSNLKELIRDLGGARGFELGSATVGLLGLGAVGKATARRLRGFGSEVICYDPLVPDEVFRAHEVTRVELDDLFSKSDVLSLHCAVTSETRGIVSRERMATMRDGALLINTARHKLVDDEALLSALRSGKLGGAGLDVFKSEPPTKDDPFFGLDNVVCTPHIGGATRDVIRHQTDMVARDIDRILRGERPYHCVNPAVLSSPPER
jgi:autoinducer 2 (AI-2) kinase